MVRSQQLDDIRYWLAMLRTPGLGNHTIRRLLQNVQPEAVFSAPVSQLNSWGLLNRSVERIKNPDWKSVDRDLLWLEGSDNHLVTFKDSAYPELLQQINDPPAAFFVRGDVATLQHPQIAIVGSRNPSKLGQQTATDFAESLATHGFTITSGLALGIDAAAHRGALDANGYTIAVAGTGPDRIYPAKHKILAEDIISRGALISEFLPGTPAKGDHFPRRNRIISGLCAGLLVVEAAKQSGSLITARLALEQNREVFAIPGSIHNPLARGCNALIRQGAKLVETCEDILEELGHYNQSPNEPYQHKLQTGLDLEQQNLLNLVQFSPTSIDDLVRESGLAIEVVSSILLVLELEGFIASATGGHYIRITE